MPQIIKIPIFHNVLTLLVQIINVVNILLNRFHRMSNQSNFRVINANDKIINYKMTITQNSQSQNDQLTKL
jgi:hypothetical protein